jgi:hypothetical protein
MQRYSKQRHVLQPVSGPVVCYGDSFIRPTRECQVYDWKNGDPPHKAVCSTPKRRSAALLKQIAMLEQYPSVDYFLVRPAPLPELGFVIGGEGHGAELFRRMRKLAFEKGDKRSVGFMYDFLDSEIKTTPACVGLDGLDAQITQEFGFTMEEIRGERKAIDGFWDRLQAGA